MFFWFFFEEVGNMYVWPKDSIGYGSLLPIAYMMLRPEYWKYSHFIKGF